MILEIIGKEIIIESTKAVLGLVTDLEDHEDPYVNRVIEDLDIHVTISTIESLIDISESKFKIRNNDKYDNNKYVNRHKIYMSINSCVKNINDIINKIKKEMEEIKRLLPLHKQKWFHTLRTPEYYTNLDNIKRYNTIMKDRFSMLLNIIRTFH